MSEKDLKLASNISQWVSQFPEEWQEYQDWLREIIASHQVLRTQHSAWFATLIFRWRLVYFSVYVGSIAISHRLQSVFTQRKAVGLSKDFDPSDPLPSSKYFFFFQRLATLIAVAELTLCGIAAFTGIMLAYYYEPTAMGAHRSLSAIATQISYGSLILSLHDIAGNALIVLALIQIVVMFLGRQFLPSWLVAWISGIFLTIFAIGLSWTAVVLNWDQIGFWRFKIELGTIGSIPFVGGGLRALLTGGAGISSLTVQHLYTLHSYILAIAGILLSIIHLTALLYQEQTWKQRGTSISTRKQICEPTL